MDDDVKRVTVAPAHKRRLCTCCLEPADVGVSFNVSPDSRIIHSTSVHLSRACTRLAVDALKEAVP